jgi:hypothetical protein
LPDGLVIDTDSFNQSYAKPLRFQVIDESLFMSRAALPEELQKRVPDLWLLQSASCDGNVEAGQVSAIEVPDQI